jgi:hypothetical protein
MRLFVESVISTARLRVPGGVFTHASGGDTSAPLQVCTVGKTPPSDRTGLVSVSGPVGASSATSAGASAGPSMAASTVEPPPSSPQAPRQASVDRAAQTAERDIGASLSLLC